MNWRKKIALAALCAVVSLPFAMTGCNTANSPDYATTLYENRVEKIGNAPKDGALLELLKVNELGDYTFELQTDSTPYGLTVHFAAKPDDEAQLNQAMKRNSCLLFALIDDLDDVRWTYPMGGKTVSNAYSFAQATARLGEPISEFGTSAKKVSSLLSRLEEPTSDNSDDTTTLYEGTVDLKETA